MSHAEGNLAEAGGYVRRIVANHDAEVEEDLPTRTFDILRRHQWLPEAS
ncbi:MAG: Peptidoglycan-binding LysM [Cryptosporangiaceae bacterium]|nr:Peptidoglycan-binding LysM [Cryptosporangiaceae bacterium]